MAVIDTTSRKVPKPNEVVPIMPGCAAAITKSDTDTFSSPVHVYVGGAGTVTAVPEGAGAAGAGVAFEAPAGIVLPVRVWAVKSTGTDATDMVAVY